jgi:membrane fusion protein (multidrug efflux system)
VTLHTELAGRTSATRYGEVRPQVSGIIRERKFVEGTDVKAGQVLYQVDDAVYKAAVESAKAALAKAEANLKSAQVTASRYEELSRVDAVSRQARDDARAALAQAKADVAAAKAALESARIDLEHSRITAPIGGRIGRSSVTAGALVTAGQAQSLATIQQLDPIYVDLTRSATELMQLRRDLESGKLRSVDKDQARVKLLLPDGTPYEHEGRLQFSEVTVDPGTGSVTLRAVFPNPDRHLLPGMYVRALLEEGVRDNAILAPQRGVTRDARGQAVALVVDGEGKVAQRLVVTERAIGDQWLVSEGLAAGDRLIVEGLQKIRPGMPVTVVDAGAAAQGGAAATPAAAD